MIFRTCSNRSRGVPGGGPQAGDFTPWLAREENIELLGQAIGLDLVVEAEEGEALTWYTAEGVRQRRV